MSEVRESDRRLRYAPVPPEMTVALGPDELTGFRTAITRLKDDHEGHPLGDPATLTAIEIAAGHLPTRLLARLIEFRTVSGAGALLIKGLPVDEPLPATPTYDVGSLPWPPLAVSTIAQLGVMSVLGEVLSYADEKNGDLVQDVYPVRGAESRQENTGSELLELHVEDGFHPFRPHYLSLYCLRDDHARTATTVTASIGDAVRRLPKQWIEVLRQPLFRIRYSSSFVGDGPARYTARLPVLTGPDHDPDLCVDFHAMEGVDERSRLALAELSGAMRAALVGVVLTPGDMLVVDNRIAVHGRTGFRPRYDGRDRWLRRCFAVSDLRPSRGVRDKDGRVCGSIL